MRYPHELKRYTFGNGGTVNLGIELRAFAEGLREFGPTPLHLMDKSVYIWTKLLYI